ncbi:MAG: AsmA family protein [Janthinobacterium lividum]
MHRVTKYISSAIFILIIVLLLIPALVPSDKYKNALIQQVKKATGRDLIVEGKVSLALLPNIKIKLENVKLASLPKATYPNLFEIKEAEFSIEVLPLLTGNIVISNIHLESPKIILEELIGGQKNWEFPNSGTKDLVSSSDISNINSSYAAKISVKHLRIHNAIELQHIKSNKISGSNKPDISTSSYKLGDADSSVDIIIHNIEGPIDFVVEANDLKLKGKIEKIDDIIPVQAELQFAEEKIVLNGKADVSKLEFLGRIEAKGNLANIDILNNIPMELKRAYSLSTNIEANKERIVISNLDFQTDIINVKVNAGYDIQESATNLSLILQPGNININITSDISAQEMKNTKIELNTKDVRSLLEAMKITANIDPLVKLFSNPLLLSCDLSYAGQDLTLQNLDMHVGSNKLQGNIVTKNLATETSISYNLTLDADEILRLIKAPFLVSLPKFKTVGVVNVKDTTINIDSTTSIAEAVIKATGSIGLNSENLASLNLSIKGENLDRTLKRLSGKAASNNLGKFDLNTEIETSSMQQILFSMDKSILMLGGNEVSLSGTGTLTLKEKPEISVNLLISEVNLDDFMPRGVSSTPVLASNNKNSGTTSIPTSNSYSAFPKERWSNSKIDFSFLNQFDGRLNLLIQKISFGSLVFDNAKTEMRLLDNIVNIDSLSGTLFGGTLTGSGKLSCTIEQELNFKLSIENAQLKHIVPTQGKIKVMEGIVDFKTDIESKGNSIKQYVENLSGNVALGGRNGVLSGLNLQSMVDVLNNAKNLHDVLKVLNNSLLQGKTAFDSFDTSLIIERGLAKIDRCKLIAKTGTLTAAGTLDIPKYWLDLNTIVAVNIKNVPAFNTHLYGQFDNINYKLDTKALQKYLIDNVLTGVIEDIKSGKTNPRKILEKIFGN